MSENDEDENLFQEIYKDIQDHTYNLQIYSPKTEISNKNETPNETMLEPNHPLLIKFQQSLKEQLTRQITKLTEEVNELDIGIKKNTIIHDEYGVTVYEAQQIINHQHDMLNNCEKELKEIMCEREELECELSQIQKEHKIKNETLKEAENNDIKLRNEIEILSFLLQKMSDWHDKLESDMVINQRIKDKTKIDKRKFTEEKRNLDFLVYKLMNDILTLENNIENLNTQLEVKEKEREILSNKILEVSVDLEGLEREHRRLIHLWNNILVTISQRDEMYFALKKDLHDLQEKLQMTIIEIGTIKKAIGQEMARNEELTLIKGRINEEFKEVNVKLITENEKIYHTEVHLTETQTILTQTEKDYQQVIAENKVNENKMKNLVREIEKLTLRKVELEEKIIELLQEQITNDKVSTHMNKKIRELRERNRNCEIQIASIENQNSVMLVEIENQHSLNEESQRHLEDLTKRNNKVEHEIKLLKIQLKTVKTEIYRKQNHSDVMMRKIDELVQKAGGIEMAPHEIKIKILEKEISEKEEKIKMMQGFWLRQQSYVVTLTEKRHEQLNQIQVIERQLSLVTQKQLTLEDELDQHRKDERVININIMNLRDKLDKLNESIIKRRGMKETVHKENFYTQNDYYLQLKESELECIQLENDIVHTEEEKVLLSKQLIEVNREALTWDRKNTMAGETKQLIEKERGDGGEIGAMRAEIHRMTVRHSQLKKAQEKLIQDLDHCVLRRESILYNAEATEKRLSTGNKVNSRYNFKKKLEDMKLKIKKTENEKKVIDKQINECKQFQRDFKAETKQKENEILDMDQQRDILSINIENSLIERQKELEILLFKQHVVRAYSNIVNDDYKMLYRNQSQLDAEYNKQQEINTNLQTVVETLINDFPNHRAMLAKVLNTLKLTTY